MAVDTQAREVADAAGRTWHAVAVDSMVAHMKTGATLAFVPADEPGMVPVRSNVEFNSRRAAEMAISTMSNKELLRRLEWAKTDAGIHQ